MMFDAIKDLQTAIVTALIGTSELTNLVGSNRVFDNVPQGTKPPFVAITRHNILEDGTDDGDAFLHVMTISAYSIHHGRAQVAEILDVVRRALVGKTFRLSNHHLVGIYFDRLDTNQDIRARLWRGGLQLRALTEPV